MRATKIIFLILCVLSSLAFLGYAQTNSCDPINIGKLPPADLTYKIIISLDSEKITALTVCAYDKENHEFDLKHVPSPFQTGALIRLIIIENDGKYKPDEDNYSFGFSSVDTASDTINVFGLKSKMANLNTQNLVSSDNPILYIYKDIPLEKAGQTYSIKITRYKSFDDKLSEGGKVIFDNSVRTFNRYSFGLNAGVFFPISYLAKTYNLFYANPSDPTEGVRPIIHQRKYWNPRAIVFLSYYPCGFEPERKGTFQINVGTEISSSIMASIYLGVGYAKQYYSINIFGGYFTEKVLPDNYSINQPIQNKNISSVPLIDKGRLSVGFSLAFPFTIAGIFGKLIGL